MAVRPSPLDERTRLSGPFNPPFPLHSRDYSVTSINSICSIISRREDKALELHRQVDVSFVIGDEKSSNANKLYAKLKEADARTFFIEDLRDLRARGLGLSGFGHAMVVSSSSTPDFVEKEVVEYLEGV